jgi:3-oxoacyl-[acyl-carrier-protein] synthase II
MKREVVVTGFGIVSPIGMNAEEFERNLFAGKSGVKPIRGLWVPEDFPVPYAAWIPVESLPPSKLYPSPGRVLKSWLMTEQTTIQALEGLDPAQNIDAIVYGTADGVCYEIVEDALKRPDAPDFDDLTVKSESSLHVVRETAKRLGFKPVADRNMICVNSACACGNQALGIAYQGLRAGRWERCLVGAADARCEASNLMNFFLLGALTTDDVPPEKASRPFSADRSGFVRGEGSATLILETREAAEKRGAKIYGIVSGYGCTSDAYRLTDGREDGASVIEAMRLAVADAGLELKQIDYINAHGTSTPLNDRLETLAIKKLFGERAKSVPVSSLKSQIGHSTIASGAIEAIASLLMLKRQTVAPTLNYDKPDPELDLDYVPNKARPAALKHILNNSFGFGGQNTCTVITREDA